MSELVEALRPRAQLIAEILADRIGSRVWDRYCRDEPLVGTHVHAGEVEWHRHVRPEASMTFGFLRVRGITASAAGTDRVIASNVVERHEDRFRLDKPVKYSETLQHTFSRTTSLEEATEAAWQAAAKASLSLAYGGVTGAVEASAEYGEKLARRSAESVTTSDTISKTLELEGPVDVRWIAERSTDTLLREWEAVPDLDFKLYWRTEDSGWEWASFADVFVAAARGEAPLDQTGSVFASSSPSHDLFDRRPVPADDIAVLEAPPTRPIRFTAEYQVVTRQTIEAL